MQSRETPLVAAAAPGMSGIFGTPLAAILLAIEVLLFEWKPRSFVPVMVAVLVSLGLRPWLLGAGPVFPFPATTIGIETSDIAVGLGLIVGLEATLLSSLPYRVEDVFRPVRRGGPKGEQLDSIELTGPNVSANI